MSNDPFAGLAKTDAAEGPADIATEDFDLDFDLDFDVQVTDEAYEETTGGGGFTPYKMPADKARIPVVIVKAEIEERDMRLVVARDPATGKPVWKPKEVDDAVKAGATEVIVEKTLPRFKLEVEHVADIYGERSRSFLLGMPVYDMKMPYREGGKKRKSLGWNKFSGQRLIAATRVVEAGETVTKDRLEEIADAMVGKIVMAEVRYSKKKYTDATDRTDESGQVIKAMIDEHGSFVKVAKNGEEYFYAETGDLYDMDTSKLIEFNDGYVIRDWSDEAAPVKTITETERTFDNLNDDVYPVFAGDPKTGEGERKVEVTRLDGEDIEAEVTWNTIGQLSKTPFTPGTMAQVVVKNEKGDEETITINWIGTGWVETPEPHALGLSETGELQFQSAAGGMNTFAG